MPIYKSANALVKLGVAITMAIVAFPAFTATVFYGPTPYLSSADSPFLGGSFSYYHLEDFKDGSLNTPGVTASPGWTTTVPLAFTDSVDGDDGSIDGSGTNGRSFFSNFNRNSVTFTFNAGVLGGNLPTHAGIVWTDVNASANNRQVVFSAQDNTGNSLGSLGPALLGDNLLSGQTAEDRFFGVFNTSGISSITISMPNSRNWEVDHLQYGFVPIPASALLLLSGLAGLAWLGFQSNNRRHFA